MSTNRLAAHAALWSALVLGLPSPTPALAAEDYAYVADATAPLLRARVAMPAPGLGTGRVVEVSRVVAEQAALTGRLPVELPDGRRFEASFEREQTEANGDLTVVGKVATPFGQQSMVVTFGPDGAFGAVPAPDGRLWRLSTSHGEAVLEPDPGIRPAILGNNRDDADLIIPEPSAARAAAAANPDFRHLSDAEALETIAAGEITVTVLGVYTTNLVTLRGSAAAVETEFNNLIALANQAHLDSGSVVSHSLVGFLQTTIPEADTNQSVLDAVRLNTLPDAVDVHTPRNTLQADLVAVLRPYPGGDNCGLGYVNGGTLTAEYPDPAFGFSVSNVGNCGSYTLGHELGHNLGSTHDRANSNFGRGAYLFSHGYRQDGPPSYATVMAYSTNQQVDLGRFSHPGGTLCLGTICGVAEQSDNVRSFALMAPRIATFRGPPGVLTITDGGVWEPNSPGSASMFFTARLSSPAGAGGVTFTATSANSTATAGQDYVAGSFGVTIPQGASSASFSYTVNSDAVVEGPETFLVNITNVTGATLQTPQPKGIIRSAQLTIEDVTVTEGAAGTVNATFLVGLSRALPIPVTFDIATANGTATAGSDYVAQSLTNQSIAAGATSYSFTVVVNGDATKENNETFTATLSNVAGASVVDSQATGTIQDDDTPSLSISNYFVMEGNAGSSTYSIPVTLSAATDVAVTFNVASSDISANAPGDYTAFNLTNRTIPAGQTSVNIPVTVIGDTTFEPDEFFGITLSSVVGAKVFRATSTIEIRNDDSAPATPTLTIADVAVSEGNSGTSLATFTVQLSGPAPAPVTFNIATANGTATAGSDYVARSLVSQSIAAGQSSFSFAVTINGDTTVEPNETFTVTASSVTGATVTDGQATGTINNDDAAPLPNLTIADVAVAEGNSGTSLATFTVQLSAPAPATVGFNIATANGTATAGSDYVARSLTSQTIAAGQSTFSFAVTINGDTAVEPNETFTVDVSSVTGATVVDGQATGTINNDDSVALPTLAIADVAIGEADTGTSLATFTVQLSAPAPGTVSFNIATANGTATAGSDYVARSLTAQTIAAGQSSFSFAVTVNGDTTLEPSETFSVAVSSVTGATVSDGQAVGTILADDIDPATSTLRTRSAVSEAGFIDLPMSSLPALPNARLAGTPLATPARSIDVRSLDTAPASPYDNLSDGVAWLNFTVPATPGSGPRDYRVLVIGESATATAVRVYVGTNADGDVPELAEQVCAQTGGGSSNRCEFTVTRAAGAPAAGYWALVQNAGSSGPADVLFLEAVAVPLVAENSTLVATGPGHVPAGQAFDLRLQWNDPTLVAGGRRTGYLLVESQPGTRVYDEPVRLLRSGTTSAAAVLAPGQARTMRIAAGQAIDRVYFDVPANATQVTFSLTGTGEVDLYAAHVAAPTGPQVAAAPARNLAQQTSTTAGANETIVLSGAGLLPGRWYLTPVNTGGSEATATLTATVNSTTARPPFRSGHFYNPARSGHGVFLDFAFDQWILVWYAYLQDGSPTWYYAAGPKPAADSAQWSSDLLRVMWNGSSAHATKVGSVLVTIQPGAVDASPKLGFSFNLDGESGWEPLSRLGDDSCPAYSGTVLNASGHWYSPAQSGFGYSAQFLPNVEVHAAYLYDGLGVPRWLFGQKGFDAAQTTVPMLQLSGFCPTCPAIPATNSQVGTMTRMLAPSTNNDGLPGLDFISVNAVFTGGVPGTWSQSFPVFKLSERKGCL